MSAKICLVYVIGMFEYMLVMSSEANVKCEVFLKKSTYTYTFAINLQQEIV